MQTNLPPLDEFVDFATLRQDETVKRIFSTDDSTRWFERKQRAALVEAGALIIVAGRMQFHLERFKQVAVTVGIRAAA